MLKVFGTLKRLVKRHDEDVVAKPNPDYDPSPCDDCDSCSDCKLFFDCMDYERIYYGESE